MKKNMKGITLVSLVITIIVMLILAGVSIQMATGDNGVLTRGQQGAVKTKLASVLEELNSAVLSLTTDYRAQYMQESSMEAKKSNYFTVGLVAKNNGTVDDVEKAPSDFMNNHKGINNYLTSCQILVGNSVKNAANDITVAGATNNNTSLASIAGFSSPGKSLNSSPSNTTNCGYQLSAVYLSSDPDSTKVGGDLFVAIYYIKQSIPTFVDVALVETTGTGFKNGNGTDVLTQTTKGDLKVKAASNGVTWLNNAEGKNT